MMTISHDSDNNRLLPFNIRLKTFNVVYRPDCIIIEGIRSCNSSHNIDNKLYYTPTVNAQIDVGITALNRGELTEEDLELIK